MANLQDGIDALLRLLAQFGLVVAAALTEVELSIRAQLQQVGLTHAAQTVVLVAVAAVLAVTALRLFGGLIRVAVVLMLLLLAIHIMMPSIQG